MKTKYRHFCQTHPELPIFFQDWYLDAVCQEGEWDVVLQEENGEIKAFWTYFTKQKFGFRYVTMPLFVKFMGPYWLGNPSLTEQHRLLDQLMDQLPPVAEIRQDFHYVVQNWLPLYWRAYQQTTRYTYLLDIRDLDQVFAGINRNMRRNILKAQNEIKIVEWSNPEQFYAVNKMSFDRQNIAIPYSLEQFLAHDRALEAHQRRKIFFAIDQRNQVHSASYIIWDNHKAYYHLAGDDPRFRHHGAGILLLWESIQFLSKKMNISTLDFEGSMLKNVEAIRRQFGAKQTPYFSIVRPPSFFFKILGAGRNLKRLFYVNEKKKWG